MSTVEREWNADRRAIGVSESWRCPFCETLNNATSPRCVVCERVRAEPDSGASPSGEFSQDVGAAPSPLPRSAPASTQSAAAGEPARRSADGPRSPTGEHRRGRAPLLVALVALAIIAVGGGYAGAKSLTGHSPTTTEVPTSVPKRPSTNDEPGTNSTSVQVQVTIVDPPENTSVDAGAQLQVSAKVDPPSAVTAATLFVDDQPKTSGPNATLVWTTSDPGQHRLRVSVQLADGRSIDSPARSVTVREVITIPTTVAPTTTAPPTTTYNQSSGRRYLINPPSDLVIYSGTTESSNELGSIPSGSTVMVFCTSRGDIVNGKWGPDPYWDWIEYQGVTGYVTDEWVVTKSDIDDRTLIPWCSNI